MQANTPYSAQVYKDPVFACTMASKAAWAELARKRCTLLKSSPGSPQHGSWFCGKRDWTFQRHARLLTTKGLHRFQRKDVWKLLQTPSRKAKTHHDNTNENPFMSMWIRGCTQDAQDVEASPSHLLHQQYPSISVNIRQCVLPCLAMIMTCWDNCAVKFQPAALRLVLSTRCPSHLKGFLMD